MEHEMRKEINKFKDFLNENSEEKLNTSDVSDSYKIARIIDLLKNEDLSFHKKVLNICSLMNIDKTELELPPYIIPCKISLNNGEKHIAYLEENRSPFRFPDEEDDKRGIWIEYGKKYFNKSRKNWKIEDVKSWEFI